MHEILLLIHILSATIWTGGHIVLASIVLPDVLKQRSPEALLKFESGYEKIGMPALLIQIVTGMMLAYRYMPDLSGWFNLSNGMSRLIAFKLILLLLTVALALDARFRVLPKLSQKTLWDMAWHIIGVTCLSILFVVVGVSFRTGWFY